ncbi:MAG TPA: NAD-binding protein [Nitrospirota bacterium]|nr:NAD-binding protein [Nitrospirota bacterium]
MNLAKNLKISLLILVLLVSLSTAGYMILEGWRFLDALYMTVITVSTVGFHEVHDLSDAGRIFTILVIVFGVSVLGYTVGKLAQVMFEGQFQRFLGRKKVEKIIDELRDHYIVCGYGRIGSLICREFAAKPIPFVVVENSPSVLERLEEDGVLFLRGNATEDEALLKAGIKRAKGLVSVVTSDTENVYITLTARGLNPDLYILARSSEPGSDIKLKRAGANKVVSPYHIGGSRMAQAILRPNVVDFIEIATGREHIDLQMEEIFIPEKSAFIGQNLKDAGLRRDTGVIIVGIKKANGKMVFNPGSSSLLDSRDTLIVLGQPLEITKLENLVTNNLSAGDASRQMKLE